MVLTVEKKRKRSFAGLYFAVHEADAVLIKCNYWRFVPIIGGSFGVAKCTCSTLATTIL